MTLRRCLPALLCACAAALGCSLVKQVAASGFERPTLSFKDARLAEVSLEGATVDLTFTVDNPNDQGISLADTDYALAIEGKQLVAGKPLGRLQIPARASTDVTLPATVKFADLAASLAELLGRRSVAYQASGHIGVDTPIGVVALPFAHEGRFDLPSAPEVAIGPPKLRDVSLSSATLELPLTLTNANAFTLALGAIAGSLRISGAEVGSVLTPDVGALPANGKQTISVPVQVHFTDAIAAARALRGGGAHLDFKGELRSGTAALPFALERDVDLSAQSGAGGD
jgi:LEA14-like dessication related protein